MVVRVGAFFSEGYVLWCSLHHLLRIFYNPYLDAHLGCPDHIHSALLSRALDVGKPDDLFSWALIMPFSCPGCPAWTYTISERSQSLLCYNVYSTAPHSCPSTVCLPQIDLAPRLAALLRARVHHRTTTWLGMFGGASPKPVKLLADDVFVTHLYRTISSASV